MKKNEKEKKSVSPLLVYENLPQENCGECSYSSCMTFAVKLLGKKAELNDCTKLQEPKYISKRFKLNQIMQEILEAKETKLVIYEDKCTGCGNCVIECPINVSASLDVSGGKGSTEGSEPLVIEIRGGVVKDVNLKKCKRFTESGSTPCRRCIDACPYDAIDFI
jgi:4Fe-4S ferredoxin